MLPIIHGEFRLVADPELRFTQGGAAVADVRLVAQNRKKVGDEWQDDEDNILWVNGSVWRQYAENVAESLHKNDLVFVTGKLRSRNYETKEGEKRTVYEINIDEIGPTLRWSQRPPAPKAERSTAPAADPWAAPSSDEPPF